MATPDNFYQRLSRLFRSGPSIQRRVKGHDYRNYYGSQIIQNNYGYQAGIASGFGRETSPFSSVGQFGILDRQARYAEFEEMETTAEVASALDVIADEAVGGDDRGKSFHVFSKNPEIKRVLDELFQDTLNVEFNLRPWIRNLVKNGDFFLYIEVVPGAGIINASPIPVSEILREEGFDPEDPYAVRFKWLTRGNQYFENWQIAHFRLLGNDMFLPYGVSVLDPARRIWRVLVMMEDSMLLYRVLRSSERRVFYIDVGNIDSNDIPSFMNAAKATIRSAELIDSHTGRMDDRFNPLSIADDFFIPVRGTQQGTRIETLSGGTNATAVEDVEYMQKKLFAALKVPKAYLNYDEEIGSKATLAQEDIRFSRTIAFIQKTAIAELNKLAMIHLYSLGFDGPDLIDFELKLSNPSTVALQQRLELWNSKFDIADKAVDTELVDREWAQKNILELSEDDIANINRGRYNDRILESELDSAEAEEMAKRHAATIDQFNQQSYEMTGADVERQEIEPSQKNIESADDILRRVYGDEEEVNPFVIDYKDGDTAIKASPFTKDRHNKRRRVGTGGRDNLAMPDFKTMLNPRKDRSLKSVYDNIGESIEFDKLDLVDFKPTHIPSEFKSIMNRFTERYGKVIRDDGQKILFESFDLLIDDDEDDEEEYDFDNEFDDDFDTDSFE